MASAVIRDSPDFWTPTIFLLTFWCECDFSTRSQVAGDGLGRFWFPMNVVFNPSLPWVSCERYGSKIKSKFFLELTCGVVGWSQTVGSCA